MSEFTAGNLTLVSFKEQITSDQLSYIKELNEDWLVFFTDETGVSDEPSEAVNDLSGDVPVLFFHNAEDHGWGYRIIHKKELLAKVDVNYELEESMLMQLVEKRHPDIDDPIELLYIDDEGEALRARYMEEISASSELQQAIALQFSSRNVEHFKLFNIDAEKIQKLNGLLTYENWLQLESPWQLVEQFKELLNLEEMSWIRIRPDRIHD
ncbi:hypothetical protein AB4Z29_21475 [Paenibacillus sp. 2TAB23]|uniref:hypothetical protein n=1 Tax=Paenibacillus sp. 2TAB23 TaxID=3233004 RepID=UPI003F94A8DF